MSVTLDDFQPLTNRAGPIQIVRPDGVPVTHATSGIAKPTFADLAEVKSLSDICLVLLDELNAEVRRIPGAAVTEIRQSSPGWVIVVDDTIEPDAGKTIPTRGA